jgi:hypothetical protein
MALVGVHIASAQSFKPKGSFVQAETKVGLEVQFSLTAAYDKNINILFPDSLYDFGTFEYNSRTYFPTKSDSLLSYDSVVYHLATFEIDTIQYLRLPVFVLEEERRRAVYSNTDSISLVQVVKEMSGKIELKTNSSYADIDKKFNYPYFLIASGVMVFLGILVMLFFGKRIIKAWKIRSLRRSHKKFIKVFFALMRDATGNNPANTVEHVLAVWKQYIEKLEKKPISKLTTKEILVLFNNTELRKSLQRIDRSVYGGEKGQDLFASFDYLMNFSVVIYEDKINQIKNS